MKTAQTLKGFRDFTGEELRLRKAVFTLFEGLFQEYGFEALETPALEYAELLLDKYGEDEKLVYRFKDAGKRDVAMRYDLTVPTARVLAQHQHELGTPWKRYQIQPVWRADNTQKGRYREFYQLDADVFGASSMLVEAELLLLGNKALSQLGFESYVLRLNNRKILEAIAQYAGHQDAFSQIVQAIDKWDKRPPEKTADELQSIINDTEAVDRIMQLVSFTGTNSELLDHIEETLKDFTVGREGVDELRQILAMTGDPDWLRVDPKIARGLSYYTGPIWEWEIIDGDIGSVGSGGRYDKLVASLGGPDVPAPGTSFGIERLIDLIQERGMKLPYNRRIAQVLVSVFDKQFAHESLAIAEELRTHGLHVMLYPQARKLSKQLDYANKQQIPYVVIAGEDELASQSVLVKDMETGSQEEVHRAELANHLFLTLTNS